MTLLGLCREKSEEGEDRGSQVTIFRLEECSQTSSWSCLPAVLYSLLLLNSCLSMI